MMQGYRRRKAEARWGKEHPTDMVSPEVGAKLIWHAVSVEGMTFVDVMHATGVWKETVAKIYYQKVSHIQRRTHDKLVAGLDREDLMATRGPESLIDARKYNWVIGCLHAQGWRQDDLTQLLREAGFEFNVRHHTRHRFMIKKRNAEAIEWLMNTVQDKKGPSLQTRTRTQNQGIFPLIHYTEDGELIESSLLPEQRAILKRVQSKHGDPSSGNYGHGPRP